MQTNLNTRQIDVHIFMLRWRAHFHLCAVCSTKDYLEHVLPRDDYTYMAACGKWLHQLVRILTSILAINTNTNTNMSMYTLLLLIINKLCMITKQTTTNIFHLKQTHNPECVNGSNMAHMMYLFFFPVKSVNMITCNFCKI